MATTSVMGGAVRCYPALIRGIGTTDAYRCAGRPEAIHHLERAIHAFAHEIGMDPFEVRKNFWQPDHRTGTPSPINPMGVKGVGEAGTIGSAHTLVNAVVDALTPMGVKHIDMPVRPKRVWAAMQEARA
jgi:CO/xanthine dehydrogenase Mo-binding subunit